MVLAVTVVRRFRRGEAQWIVFACGKGARNVLRHRGQAGFKQPFGIHFQAAGGRLESIVTISVIPRGEIHFDAFGMKPKLGCGKARRAENMTQPGFPVAIEE